MKAYLTKRTNGLFLLTHALPVVATVGRSGKRDAYPQPGDLLAFNNICVYAAEAVWRAGDLEELETVRVTFGGARISEPFDTEKADAKRKLRSDHAV